MSMKVVPTAAVLGAEIAGVDLSRPLDDPTCAAVEPDYNEYGVIFFRWSVPGNREIVVLSNTGRSPRKD
jgi:hypothetical protein